VKQYPRGGIELEAEALRYGDESFVAWGIIRRTGGTRIYFGNSHDTILVEEVGDGYVEIQGKSELST
jgi:hypothetical protein